MSNEQSKVILNIIVEMEVVDAQVAVLLTIQRGPLKQFVVMHCIWDFFLIKIAKILRMRSIFKIKMFIFNFLVVANFFNKLRNLIF